MSAVAEPSGTRWRRRRGVAPPERGTGVDTPAPPVRRRTGSGGKDVCGTRRSARSGRRGAGHRAAVPVPERCVPVCSPAHGDADAGPGGPFRRGRGGPGADRTPGFFRMRAAEGLRRGRGPCAVPVRRSRGRRPAEAVGVAPHDPTGPWEISAGVCSQAVSDPSPFLPAGPSGPAVPLRVPYASGAGGRPGRTRAGAGDRGGAGNVGSFAPAGGPCGGGGPLHPIGGPAEVPPVLS